MKCPCLLLLFLCIASQISVQAQDDDKASFIQRLLAAHQIPGLSLVTLEDGQVDYVGGFGLRSADAEEPVDEHTVFAAASLSKTVFAYLVYQFAADGIIDLDRPINDYYDYPDLVDDRKPAITPRMLLSHSSGLPNWRRGELELQFDPGTDFNYSGEGYVYLQRAIEQLTGKNLEELAKERVFEPLNMTRSSYLWQENFNDNYAAAHDFRADPRPPSRPATANAAHSLQTTAADFGRFLTELLRQLKSGDGVWSQAKEPIVEVGNLDSLFWATGWGLDINQADTILWQWGDNYTFRCFVMLRPGADDAMAYFSNSQNGLQPLRKMATLATDRHFLAADWLDYPDKRSDYEDLLATIIDHGYERGIAGFQSSTGNFQDTSRISKRSMNRIAWELWQRRRWDDAAEVYRANIRLFSEDFRTNRNCSFFWIEAGNLDSATHYLAKAVAIDGEQENLQGLLERLREPFKVGNHLFRLPVYPSARSVQLIGSFNDWGSTKLPCVRRGGEWVCLVELPPGEHTYQFVVDGVYAPDPGNEDYRWEEGRHCSVLIKD